MTGPGVVGIGEDRAGQAVEVLCAAFHAYPVMRFVLGEDRDDYGERLNALVAFFVRARVIRGEPLLGIERGGRLAAAAIVSDPEGHPSPPELAAARERTWESLGPEARSRYERFGAACAPLLETVPRHLHLNMIGVRPEARGGGLARRLLEAVHDISAAHATSRGVTLTTEDSANLPFYERFGYERLGRATVTAGLETWAFFRRDRP